MAIPIIPVYWKMIHAHENSWKKLILKFEQRENHSTKQGLVAKLWDGTCKFWTTKQIIIGLSKQYPKKL